MSAFTLIQGVPQHYDWGGYGFIPQLLGTVPEPSQPWAEYWLGVHPKGMARLEGTAQPLAARLAAAGASLPFLLKVLDVRASLSIQVHPDKARAVAGFAAENGRGLALEAGDRNYRDDNHKPEVMVALTPCVLLYGFSAVSDIIARCRPFPSLDGLVTALQQQPLAVVYRQVLQAGAAGLDSWLAPLLADLLPRWRSGQLRGEDHAFWLARAAAENGAEACRDPGLLALLMMNLVHVAPGEAIFQPARLPHAYLHGCNVELMANSDNVLRGGLTRKHVDVAELLAVVEVEPVVPAPVTQRVSPAGVVDYLLPTDEFHLRRVQPGASAARVSLAACPRPAIVLNMGATCQLLPVANAGEAVTPFALPRGGSLLVAAGQAWSVTGAGADLFVAW